MRSKIFLFLSLFLVSSTAFAQSDVINNEVYHENWAINSYEDQINISSNGQVEITENILADFTNEAHRGIARNIPQSYSNDIWADYDAEIDFVSATDENGHSYNNTVYTEGNDLVVEMRTLTGELTNGKLNFVLKYLANNVLLFVDEAKAQETNSFAHDEFYWNVNGTQWVVPIKKLTAEIILPGEFTEDQLKFDCYTGKFGEKNKDCKYSFISPNKVLFEATKELAAYENMSILIAMPSGTIVIPESEKIMDFLSHYWGLFLAALVAITMITLWYKKGRDDKTVKDTVMPHYAPPKGFSPIETGCLFDEKLDSRDIISVIIDQAVKGHIKITEIEKDGFLGLGKSTDYELELIKPYEKVSKAEEEILKNIFNQNSAGEKTNISDLKNKFYKHIKNVEKFAMKDLVAEGYFPNNPSTVRGIFTGIGIVIAFLGIQTLGVFLANGIGIIISGLIIIIVGRKMPRKTSKGTETYYQLKGLYEYINTAEKDRMKFQEDSNLLFEKLLPYAMAFGLISKWTTAFEGILKTPPAWFIGGPHFHEHGFSMDTFANSMESFGKDFGQTLTSKPGGSGGSGFGGGGGFSGGGFGGGGGHGL